MVTDAERLETLKVSLPTMAIDTIAREISKDWKNPYFGARPYLEAMFSLTTVGDRFGYDDGVSIVAYFLANASKWRGPVAKLVKAELKGRCK